VSVTGRRYEGYWKDDVYNGKGKLIQTNGTIHEGVFLNGRIQGMGRQT